MDTLTRGMYGIEFEHPPQPPPLSRERLELELKNTRIFRRKIIAMLSLLNAKNVIQEPVNPPHANRAARRRKDPPPFAYHVLKVRPFAAKIRRQGGSLSDHNVLPQAIHWVRGHFKRYTPERPLLGRHTGVFWFQPHLAGKNPRRVVAKDYEIKN
jgi:hypothetical protein